MYLTLLEYLLVRVTAGLALLVFRAAGLLVAAACWLLWRLARLVLRPLSRELAYAAGRVVGHVRLAGGGRAGRA